MANIFALPAPGYAKALLEENESLRGALQAALLSLEAASDALIIPGARPGFAVSRIEDAIVVLQEELEDDTKTAA